MAFYLRGSFHESSDNHLCHMPGHTSGMHTCILVSLKTTFWGCLLILLYHFALFKMTFHMLGISRACDPFVSSDAPSMPHWYRNFPTCVETKGCSPVWAISCLLRLSLVLNDSEQISYVNWRSFSWYSLTRTPSDSLFNVVDQSVSNFGPTFDCNHRFHPHANLDWGYG